MKEFMGRFPSREGNKRVEKTQSYCDRIQKQPVINFSHSKKPVKKLTILEDGNGSFGEILFCYNGKKLHLCFIVNWSLTVLRIEN